MDSASSSRSSETEECDSDREGIVGMHCMSTGSELEEFGDMTCMKCKVKIERGDSVKVFKEGVAHVDCELHKSRGVQPVDPQYATKRRAEQKAKKGPKGSKEIRAQGKAATFGGDKEKANSKHEHLMIIAKPLQRKGKAKGDTWRIRYEPIKPGKASSWLDTRHQVVFRWGNGTSKSVPFDFDEEHKNDEEFVKVLGTAMEKLVADFTA